MAGVTLTIDDRAVLETFYSLGQRVAHPVPLLQEWGEILLQSTRQRFVEMVDPQGNPWTSLSPVYRASKKKNQNRILVLEGHLYGTLVYQLVGESAVDVGSPLIYAATQQLGRPDDNIPARPFLGINMKGDRDALLEAAADYLLPPPH